MKTIVDGKIRDGQLSDSPLTLREIDLIQEQFVKVVAGMFHHRLDYPATQHLTKAQVGSPPASPPVGAGADEVATATPPGPDGEEAAAVPEAREAGRKKAGGGSGNEQLPLDPTDEESPSRDPHADE